ncbi:GTP-sensing pleiotropic transcriptional regulator CodY [Lachnospira multipara]|uniref:GTP-sensing pleiotropic transcriptional regulator CodY n=1 Tax=Lachnospira multipara TaxID=28051 RepID=UPI0004E0EC25|nr:GTP-sensing pleiotropic transcriptional regulator CodY [Lachnospira multipara]
MSIELLDKTRKINKILHNNHMLRINFTDICLCLSDILKSDILVISKKGKVLGRARHNDFQILDIAITKGGFIDKALNERLLSILSTNENVNLATLGFKEDRIANISALITPIYIAGKRLGTLFICRDENDYDIDDIILSEYGTTVIGLSLMQSVNEESATDARKRQVVKLAISTLSSSELIAMKAVLNELDGFEGILVASRIADKVGITRSVIVNALRKFESANIIETRSSGMKGTYIKVVNDLVFDEIKTF